MRTKQLLCAATLCAALSAPAVGQVQAYLVDTTLDQLFSVDLATGAATLIASVANNGLGTAADLAWRGDTQELWTIDLGTGAAGTIDVVSGLFTPIHMTGVTGWQGMAWDPVTKLFYLANQDDNNYTLDPATGAFAMLGYSGFGLITCLDVDATGTLWGIDFSTSDIVKIDKNTGVGTSVGKASTGFQGLGIDQTTGTWYGSNTNDDSLHKIDPVASTVTLIGAHGAGVTFAKGFDLVDSTCTQKYGTGCPGTGGFVPDLGMTGCPDVGKQVTLNLTNGLGGSMMAVLVSAGQGSAPVGGTCTLLVTPTPFVIVIPLGGSGPGAGMVSVSAIIPNVPPAKIYLQAFVKDSASPIGLSASNGLKLDIK